MDIKNYAKKIMKNELFIGSLSLFVLMNIGSFLNYLFHFSMARLLGPADYSILAVITSIIYIFGVPESSIRTFMSKFTTKFNVKKQFGKIKGLLKCQIKRLSLLSLFVFAGYIVVCRFLSKQLDIPFSLLVLAGVFLFSAVLYSIGTGVLQGMKKFKAWGWNFVINGSAKLIFAIGLVLLGFGVYGAVLGFIFGMLVAFLFIFPSIKEVMKAREQKEEISVFSKNNFPIFLSMLIIAFMYSFDMIIVKGLFSAEMAGMYSVVSMIGKIIFFSALSIQNAMFPISSEKFANGSKAKTKNVIRKTWIVIISLCSLAIIAFAVAPGLVIRILFGSQYLSVANVLVYIGIAFSFLSFLNTLVLYRISVEEFEKIHLLFLAFFLSLEITMFSLFNSTIKEFSIAFMVSAIISFVGGCIFIRKPQRKI